jgi:hypothetical protein
MKPLALALLLLTAPVALPAASRAAIAVSVAPASYLTERGGDGGEPVAQLAALDQSGTDDDPTRYVTFTTPAGRYRGTRSFVLPPEAPAGALQAIALQVSFRTASPARTTWKWKIYDTRKRRFVKLGSSKGAPAGVWTTLQLAVKPVKGDVSRFVDAATGEVRIRFQSSNGSDDVRVDQEELQLQVREPPSLGSCPLFPADHWWNARVDALPVDPRSDDYVQALGADTGVHPDFGAGLWQGAPIGIPWTSVSAGQPLVDVSFYYDDSDPGPYPIPPDAPIEGGPQSNGDRHVLVVDNAACLLYEIFDAHPGPGDAWEGGSGAVFDLQSNALRPDGWTSADAAGFAILPGLVRYEEVAAGEIAHALRFTAADIRYAYSWPARHRATCGGHGEDDLSVPPMGQRFRLKASFDVASYSPQVQVVLVAMQRYGIVLADCGSNWYVSGAPDPGFDDDALVSELAAVKGSDFEAVDTSSLQVDPDSAQVQTPAP